MRRNPRLLILAALAATTLAGALAITLPAVAGGSNALALRPGSTLWLTGTSTLHDYEARASQLEVTFACDPARWPAERTGADAIEALIRAQGVSTIDVIVAVTGLKSHKEGLDKNMYKALLAEKHPEIRFHVASYEMGAADSAGLPIAARGALTVAGVEREITIAAHALREGEAMRLRAEVPLLMTDYGVNPPRMMMGTIKTGDRVVVHFDLRLGIGDAQGGAPAAASGPAPGSE